ncbi:MAG: amidase [Candidatus Heimdallarchaeota archaeon]|nr:amidase [Candidatus Heimdallarchaeota archaeon]
MWNSTEEYLELEPKEVFDTLTQQYEKRVNAICTCADYSIQTAGRLSGLPILIKDSLLTFGIRTTCGSKQFQDFIPDRNASIVQRVLDEGAIIVGKTNTPENTMDYQCFNSIFGTTNNPYDLTKTSGGSSGGSAAALAMRYVAFAIGTDLGGSLRLPASFCGIYSFRPTFGSFEDSGHLPPGDNNYMAIAGPMATDMKGLALLWSSIKNIDLQLKSKEKVQIIFSNHLYDIPIDSRIKQQMDILEIRLEEKGHSITPYTEYPLEETNRCYMGLFNHMIKNEKTHLEEYLNLQKTVREYQEKLLRDSDIWILPVCSVLPYEHNPEHKDFFIDRTGKIGLDVVGDKLNYWVANGYYCRPVSVSGFPTITIPLCMIESLPVGIQLIGKPGMEEDLFDVAYTIDTILGRRIPIPSIISEEY